MAQFSKQFAIIEKIKSLVKKTGKIFISKPDSGISEEIARKIQKSAYELTQYREKDNFTPPYMLIAEQLQLEDDQIFRAAVHNLTSIAKNEQRYVPAIVDILNGYTKKEANRTAEQIEYINYKLNQIKNYRISEK